MYAAPSFRIDDRARLLNQIARAPFATLIATGADGPVAAHIPLLVEGDALVGHVARGNPILKAIGTGAPGLAIFLGPDHYVSPGWYPSKKEHGKVVPTWNYGAVHVAGNLSSLEDQAELHGIVARLSDTMEAGRADPWSIEDAPADYTAAMLKAIVGVRLEIVRLEGIAKFSQNKSEADRQGVADGLRADGDKEGAGLVARAGAQD